MYPNLETESPAPGITLEWIFNRRIVIFRGTPPNGHMSREFVDAWVETAVRVAHEWPHGQPYLSLSDPTRFSITNYARSRMMQLSHRLPHNLLGRSAILVNHSPISPMIRVMTGQMLGHRLRDMEHRFFHAEDEAVVWLMEMMKSKTGSLDASMVPQ